MSGGFCSHCMDEPCSCSKSEFGSDHINKQDNKMFRDEPLIVVVKFPDSDFWATFAHIFNAMAFAEIQIGNLGCMDSAQISEMILTLADPMHFMDQGHKDLPESLDAWAAFRANLNDKPARIRDYFGLSMEVFVGKCANDILMLPKCPFSYYALDTRLPEDERFIQGAD